MAKNREGYGFSRLTKKERLEGVRGKCESCGKTDRLYAHHLIPVSKARRNSRLPKHLVKSEENCQMICEDCHKVADEVALNMPPRELGILAWSLFDLPPQEVAEAQNQVPPRQVKKSRRRRRR